MKRKISILGSTGSIGTQALEVIEKLGDKLEIVALTGGHNTELLNKQIAEFKPKYAYADDKTAIKGAKYCSLDEICSNKENDIILVAVSGKIGLKPTITVINNGIDIALANKETLVMAGDIVMKLAKEKGVNIIPVDSEHCAIHQCIKDISQVEKLIITASGGPFLNKSLSDMKNATVEQALAHPRWNMGKKITIDSATLMNKGLEVIEAHHLFGMDYDKIDVVVHPQSIVHSAIEYVDGSVIAQLGLPSMHIPIQYAITYPERFEGIKSKSFSFSEIARLDFEKPDYEKFKALHIAYECGKLGGSFPVCMNASNEEAVFAFINGKIKLFDIINIVEKMLENHTYIKNPTIDEIFEIDKQTRIKTTELINRNFSFCNI
ncbi:MAG: 1-deoxy-D-xylulose-5-phosphate reductoisomerase [bacterium]|nr:1-deoxy-D-xylulose-5-phosphate reductoisomerase [bacterium]